MSSLVGQHQVTTFTTPVNGATPIDANTVRGNDNTIKTAYDAHDSDTTIHLQSSTLAARPAASLDGQKWMTSDGLRIYYDNGATWSEVAYFSTGGGTITGNVVITGTLSVSGAITATSGVIGNASTATALATPRAINGVNFDGTAPITVTAAAGTLTGATLATNVLASSLTSVGTLSALIVSPGTTAVQALTATSGAFSGAVSLTNTTFSQTGHSGLVNAFSVDDTTGLGFYIVQNTLNFNLGANSDQDGWLNFRGFNNGTTRFRNLVIGDGKQNEVVRITGTSKLVAFSGSISLLTAVSRIIPGATSISLRNNADSADNLIILDSGAATFRSTGTFLGGTVTTSAPILDLAQTWNAAGTTFTGLKLNITNTASAAASLLVDIQFAAASVFKVSKAGPTTITDATGSGVPTLTLSANNNSPSLSLTRTGTGANSAVASMVNDGANPGFAVITGVLWAYGGDLLMGSSAPGNGSATGNVFRIQNVSAAPSVNPVGGGILYAEAGALKYRGSSGTVTTVGPA